MSYVTFNPWREELGKTIAKDALYIRGRVLDVGGGAYRRYAYLFEASEYTTVDLSSGADVHGDARKLPFPDSSFDSIVCTQVIGDIFELNKVFAEFARVLKPMGYLLLTESLFYPLHDEPYDYWRFTPHSLRELAIVAGLNVIRVTPIGSYATLIASLKLRHFVRRINKESRIQVALYNRFARFVMWLARGEKSDPQYASGYALLARKFTTQKTDKS